MPLPMHCTDPRASRFEHEPQPDCTGDMLCPCECRMCEAVARQRSVDAGVEDEIERRLEQGE